MFAQFTFRKPNSAASRLISLVSNVNTTHWLSNQAISKAWRSKRALLVVLLLASNRRVDIACHLAGRRAGVEPYPCKCRFGDRRRNQGLRTAGDNQPSINEAQGIYLRRRQADMVLPT